MTEATTTPEATPAPEPKAPRGPLLNIRIGFSFGFFAFLLSPLVLLQAVLLLFFYAQTEPLRAPEVDLSQFSELADFVRLTNWFGLSVIALAGLNGFIATCGILFDKRRIWAIIALVLTGLALLLSLPGPSILAWQPNLF